MRSASKLLIKPVRWSPRQWRLVRARASGLGKPVADYLRDLVAVDVEYEVMELFIVGIRDARGGFPVIHEKNRRDEERKRRK